MTTRINKEEIKNSFEAFDFTLELFNKLESWRKNYLKNAIRYPSMYFYFEL